MSPYLRVRLAIGGFVAGILFVITQIATAILPEEYFLAALAILIGLLAMARYSVQCPKCGMKLIDYGNIDRPTGGLILDENCPECHCDLTD